MDRIDAMLAFVTTVELGGFSVAARRLGRSPASITRAVAYLEERTGSLLLRRTTRALKLTDAGRSYLDACRRILDAVDAAEQAAERERSTPQGQLSVTAPVMFGRLHVRPLVDALLAAEPNVSVRLVLLDRIVHLVEEGMDVAIRIAHLPDSSLLATKVGEVRRVVCASPAYLERRRSPKSPRDLSAHECISFSQVTPSDVWSFAARRGGRLRQVRVRPRLVVNTAEAAIGSALAGRGVVRVLSYQVQGELASGRLVELLASSAPAPLPVHVVVPAASATSAKLRAFVELAVPRLREVLARAC